jgi:hypothetical protein
MTVLTDAYAQGHAAALQKFAATRALKEIRKAVSAGSPAELARANRIAKTPGVLSNNNGMGSQLGHLGAGGEGLSTTVAHPQHGVSVRKMFDPNAAAYSPEIIRRKEEMPNLPGVAKLLGTADTQHGTRVHFNEYVPGQDARGMAPREGERLSKPKDSAVSLETLVAADRTGRAQMAPEQQKAYLQAMTGARRGAQQHGYRLNDMRPPNARVTPQGDVKFVDHMPFKPDEIDWGAQRHQRRRADTGLAPEQSRYQMRATDKGLALFPGAQPDKKHWPRASRVTADGREVPNYGQFTGHMLGKPVQPGEAAASPGRTGTVPLPAGDKTNPAVSPFAKTQIRPAVSPHAKTQIKSNNPLMDLL